ncbi:MAG: DEAD/DEAH box helicase [Actinomycetia bacterium]|nr:DEAD/DEAH box helicase [Actinomycetes bacterium]
MPTDGDTPAELPDALAGFSEPARAWFTTTFGEPTRAQALGWPAIAGGDHTLILAPTGSGKTLSAFFWSLDQLATREVPDDKDRRTRVLYLSPLRALAVDIEKNLRAPLHGVDLAAHRLGVERHVPTVGMRTGDTPADERRALVRRPPDVLITTPESLYLMLTSKARETLQGVEVVIIDEIHAMAGTKRGSHMAVSLERLEAVTDRPPQRIGLSATQRPLDEIARFLGGFEAGESGRPRPVAIVDAGLTKQLEIEVVVPVDDMGALGDIIDEPVSGPAAGGPVRRSIWPSMHPRLLELVQENRSTLIFVNARRLAERLATRLNELALQGENRGAEAQGQSPAEGHELVKAHHGSLSRERRLIIEDELKRGDLKGLVATSSLELGIDMGAVDLVVQVESPGAVSRGLQRIGRAGHQVGAPSRGRLFPKHRSDLVETAVVVQRMHDGLIEETRYPRNPLDVLAQHIVAMVALDDWSIDDLAALVRGAAPFAELSDEVLHSVLDLLSGRYPSEEFGELRPRIVWDRVGGTVRGRAGAQRIAVTNAGTIPDRGLFGVFLPDGTRVGELDEEMVYESRPGETFLLGASTWRIEDITHERVVVSPAPGQSGKMPFWHGDGPGRPLELGRALGAFVREIRHDSRDGGQALDRLRDKHGLDPLAAQNLVGYLAEQAEATGVVPDDRTIVVERFRDEIGDWRVCILSPFGAQVHAPWGMALQHRLAEQWGLDVELMWSDDGIVLRLPDAVEEFPIDELLVDPDEISDIVVSQLPSTAMFAARFRECAARALLLPRRRPDQRTPLWQQRQRAADLLTVAAKYPSFPILLETTRECVNDVFDLPALRQLLGELRSRKIRIVTVDTASASPMAQSLLFGWIAQYMYEGDAPLAERRAAALALDRDLLRELLGAEELRDLLDADVLADLELELQRLTDGRRARDADEVHDLLRTLGPLTALEVMARCDHPDPEGLLEILVAERRAIPVGLPIDGGVPAHSAHGSPTAHYGAAEDAARLRDALGVALPQGLPQQFTEPVDAPLAELLVRFARTHGPFLAADVVRALGAGTEPVRLVLEELTRSGRLVRGEFRPDGADREWCDADVLRTLRRRSLAALRREVEPVDGDALARFLPDWQGVGSRRHGLDALADVVTQLQGAALPASVLEGDVLAGRVTDFAPSMLDELCTSGELVWVGAGALGAKDGRIRLVWRDQVGLLVPAPAPLDGGEGDRGPADDLAVTLLDHLSTGGASFWPELVAAAAAAEVPYDDTSVVTALWDLVWQGLVTNDSLAPVRALVGGGNTTRRRGAGSPRGRRPRVGGLTRSGPPAATGRWSVTAPLRPLEPTPTEASHARALQLLERYGVLTREAALAEGAEGGFAGVYPVLKALEERGEIRRGYFVAGLGAAQFALPGAVDRLRDHRGGPLGGDQSADGGQAVVLAATDPAQPFGASLPWPDTGGRPSRSAGAFVVLRSGRPEVFLERGGRSIVLFEAGRAVDAAWPEALKSLVSRGRVRSLEIAKLDGETINGTETADRLKAAGWIPAYRGLTHR